MSIQQSQQEDDLTFFISLASSSTWALNTQNCCVNRGMDCCTLKT